MNMTPREIVEELDRYIIGQKNAKKAVANALRNRWRRQQVAEPMRAEITPKNILMIGPTGVGKTEIARRIAKLAQAPFIKVEATKFTEVGYVGRDVDSIARDLISASIKLEREKAQKEVHAKALSLAEERILDALVPHQDGDNVARKTYRERFLRGELNDKMIEIEVMESPLSQVFFELNGVSDDERDVVAERFRNIFSEMPKVNKKQKIKVEDAFLKLVEEAKNELISEQDIKERAIQNAEQNGIVFIDEIDKVAKRSGHDGSDVSREGVQRDLLPLIEGCTINTRHGSLKTDHILFITSGAFHFAKPSDLIPELQGRLPVRVELEALHVDDFEKILLETDHSLIKQYQALFAAEKIELSFSADGIRRIAELAYEVNKKTENIGARRLHTLLERLLEDASFEAADLPQGSHIEINQAFVNQHLHDLVQNEDLSRFIL